MPLKALSHFLLAANVSAKEITKVGQGIGRVSHTKQAIVAGQSMAVQGDRAAVSLPSGCVEPF